MRLASLLGCPVGRWAFNTRADPTVHAGGMHKAVYNHAPENYRCPSCLLIQGVEHPDVLSVQSDIVHHGEKVTAFVGSHQWSCNHGNVIIVPNEHFENIYDLPAHYALDIHQVAKRTALAMKAIYSCDGVSARQHNEPAGNQDVWHYHLHVTPRYKGDGFYFSRRELMPVDERAKHAARLREYLAEHSEESTPAQGLIVVQPWHRCHWRRPETAQINPQPLVCVTC